MTVGIGDVPEILTYVIRTSPPPHADGYYTKPLNLISEKSTWTDAFISMFFI
jgi:hypothetical protein